MKHTFRECLMKIFTGKKTQIAMGERLAATKRSISTRVLQPAHTIRLRPEREEPGESSGTPGPFILASSGITDTGHVRDGNEDSYSMLTVQDKSLFVVADGMGGHDAGEVASRTAAGAACRAVAEEHERYEDPLRLVERAVHRANDEVRREGLRKSSDMGTTLSIALIAGGQAYVANVGDSRVYWIENGSISQITADHSLVAKLVAAGKVSKEEARNHPRANLLYRTIGSDEIVKVDTFQVPLKKGGALLLCTDGLWGEVSDEDIHRIFTEEQEAAAACIRLVTRAKANGGRDNITAVAIKTA